MTKCSDENSLSRLQGGFQTENIFVDRISELKQDLRRIHGMKIDFTIFAVNQLILVRLRMAGVLKIDLSGCLILEDQDGLERTPRGQKTCGMVALLATAPNLKRPRRWLQSKLWSDRGADQANASLRQSLAELRKALGALAHLLQADRKEVWLDPAMVRVIMPGDPEATGTTAEDFLSGIDIRDDAFEDWLREMRMTVADAPETPQAYVPQKQAKPLAVRLILPDPSPRSDSPFVTSVSAQEIAKYVCERTLAKVGGIHEQLSDADRTASIEIRCDVNAFGNHSQTHFQAVRLSDGIPICSRFEEYSCVPAALLANPDYRQTISEFAEQVIFKISDLVSPETRDSKIFSELQTGISDIFSYDTGRLNAAEAKLLSAYERTGNPSILIWLAWQKTTQVIEEATDDKVTATDMARYYCSKALEAEPHSAFANAMSSLVHMIHFDDVEASFLLAEHASGLSKFDPYVQAALATANMFAGRSKEAAQNSLIGTKLSRFAGNAHWWDLSHSLACLSNGDLVSTEKYALRASKAAPDFRAPRRVLLALYANQDKLASAAEQMRALKRVEPTFEMSKFLNDPEYPNTTVRKAGLLKNKEKFDLG